MSSVGNAMLRIVPAFLGVMFVSIPNGQAAQVTWISDLARGFSLTLPEGFTEAPLPPDAPDIFASYSKRLPGTPPTAIILFMQDLHGLLGRERISSEALPSDFRGSRFTVRWQGFDLDAFRVPEQFQGTPHLTFNVQVPLKPAAIQLRLFGPADREAEMRALLQSILDGFNGQSNWLDSVGPPSVAASKSYGTFLLVLAVTGILSGLVILWLVSRKTPRGTVLAIAIAVYLLSHATDGSRIREMHLLTGSLRMLGFAGGLLGLVDLFRRR